MPTATLITDSTPKLSEVARHLIIPEGIVTTVFPRIEKRMNGAGIYFDRWQQGLGSVALGCRENGKYAASVGGNTLSIPRQVAKTFFVRCVVTGLCLEFPDTHWVWTSHHGTTTNKTFANFQALVQRKAIREHLKPDRSNGIRSTNGQQQIAFRNGSLIQFGAREQGFGRGMDEVDGEVFDEAQILSIDALEDMVPATNQAKHPHGGLLFFMGTPPRPKDAGEAFTEKRQKALDGKTTDALYLEISAEPGTDPEDESKWPTFNPSYPLRTPRESMLRMLENIPNADSREREMMGIWPAVSADKPIVTAAQWGDLFDIGPPDTAKPAALGVDMSHARDVAVDGCWIEGEMAHLEVVWAGSDATAALDWIAAQAGRRIPVVIDGASPAASFVPGLRARGCNVIVTAAGQMAQACGILEARVAAETLTHCGQEALTTAMLGAKRRHIRDAGGWGLDRRDPNLPIHPAVAGVLALLGATTTTRPKTERRSSGRRAVVL